MTPPIVRLPEGFFAISSFPGYFWHLPTQRLYSIKSGTLKGMKVHSHIYRKHHGKMLKEAWPHYALSMVGKRVYVGVDRLLQIERQLEKEPIREQVLRFIPYD